MSSESSVIPIDLLEEFLDWQAASDEALERVAPTHAEIWEQVEQRKDLT